MSGRSLSQTTVFEERPLHVTLALHKRTSDNSLHGVAVQAPTTTTTPQVSSSPFAELLDVGDAEPATQGSLDSSLGVPPPPPPDSYFAASLPEVGVGEAGEGLMLSSVAAEIPPSSSSSASSWSIGHGDEVQDALVSTRNVVGLFSPSADDMAMLDMLQNRLKLHVISGSLADDEQDFFVKYGGHRVVTTFKAILGEQLFKDLLVSGVSREKSRNGHVEQDQVVEKELSERHGNDIDSALKMILAIPKDVAVREIVQSKLKPMWTRVCEHADLKLDGTPIRKKKMVVTVSEEIQGNHETTPIMAKVKETWRRSESVSSSTRGSPSQPRRRMSSRLVAVAHEQRKNDKVVVESSSRGLRRSKRNRDSHDDEDVPPQHDPEGGGEEEEVVQDEMEEEDASQALQQEKQPRLDVEMPVVNAIEEAEIESSKDQEEESHLVAESDVEQKRKEREGLEAAEHADEENASRSIDQLGKIEEVHHMVDNQLELDSKKREREENDVEDNVEKVGVVEDPHVSHARVLLTLMEEDAKATMILLDSLTKTGGDGAKKEVNMSIPVEDLTPPRPLEMEVELEAEGESRSSSSILEEELRCCLAIDPFLDEPTSFLSSGSCHQMHQQKPVERIGVLMRWWRLVRRSFGFAGLWHALKKKQNRTKKKCRKSLKDMYGAEMKEIQSHSSVGGGGEVRVYGFDQAVKYVELGEFLMQFPQFVMQTLRIRLSDWLKPLKDYVNDDGSHKQEAQRRRPFIDIIKELLLHQPLPPPACDDPALQEDEKSNSKKRRGGSGNAELLPCNCCSDDDADGDMVKCSGCDCWFHEHCAGYGEGVCFSTLSIVGGGSMLEGSVYCSDCLVEKQLSMADVEDALGEQHGLAEYLNGEDCPFVFKHVDRDGFCLFRNLVEFAFEVEPSWLSLSEGDATEMMCKKIMEAAVDATEEARREFGEDAVDTHALKALHDVKNARGGGCGGVVNAIKRRWLELDAEQIIRGFVQMFRGRVAVKVFRLVSGRDSEHQQSSLSEQVYPEVRDGSERVLCLFHWHSLLHFDRLTPKIN